MTTKEYIVRLKQLSDGNKEILQRITKLSKLTSAAEGQADEEEEGESRIELGEEIHESLKEIETEFELFRQEAEDFANPNGGVQRRRDSERDKERLLLVTQIEGFSEDLKASRGHFRRAQLQAKRKEEEDRRKRARDQLFAAVEQEGDAAAAPAAGGRRRGKNENRTQEDVVLSAAGDVTAGLRRTHQLMTQELERSRFAHDTLQKSTAALNSLSDSYTGLDDLLKSSRSLISTLVSSQKSDTWYLETALKIAVATLIWLIFRRWFYGPILYLVYKPSRFMLGAIYSALNLTLGLLTGTVFKLGDDGAAVAVSGTTRPPLIIKPSASGGIPQRKPNQGTANVKVGLGGGGEAEGRSPEEKRKDEESYHQWVAQMADLKKQEEELYAQGAQDQQEGAAGGPVQTGDGKVLQDRAADQPANPKKRMMEVAPEPPSQDKSKGGKEKDEL